MSITEINKIDIVASRPDSDVVKLVIADHLGWDDLQGHSELLQDKINTYLEFIESGQLRELESPRIPESPQIWITLAAEQVPTPDAREFLARVEDFLAGVEIRFEVRVG